MMKNYLSEENLQTLDDFFAKNDMPPFTYLHGFLTAVISSPALIPPSEWIDYSGLAEVEFSSKTEAEKIMGTIFSLNNAISEQLQSGDFEPFSSLKSLADYHADKEIEAITKLWTGGYVQGAMMYQDEFFKKENEKAGVFFSLLASFNLSDEEIAKDFQQMKGASSDTTELVEAIRRDAIKFLPLSADFFYRHWRKKGNRFSKTISQSSEKVGRNEPCPCGSGKKFKKCCGKNGQSVVICDSPDIDSNEEDSNYSKVAFEARAEAFDKIIRERPHDWQKKIEELEFDRVIDGLYENERAEEEKAKPENKAQELLVEYFDGRINYSHEILQAYVKETADKSYYLPLLRKYFKAGNQFLENLLFEGLKLNPADIELLSDLSFLNNYKPILRKLIEAFTKGCLVCDLEIFEDMAMDFEEYTCDEDYDAYSALKDNPALSKKKLAIVKRLMKEREEDEKEIDALLAADGSDEAILH
jgi:uncharacterized protein